jgi:glycogen debranching enzyme
MGHCLHTGIVDAGKADAVADQLMSPPMFTGWDTRTLASNMRAYNPMSYHNRSVWPHDNAIIAAGLRVSPAAAIPPSCSPQAWASAAPLHLLRTLLRFEPCVPCHQLRNRSGTAQGTG